MSVKLRAVDSGKLSGRARNALARKIGKPGGTACIDCPLRKAPCVPTEFHKDAKIMIVGEAPGAVEVEVGYPFSGPTGRATNQILKRIGVSREQATWTNAVLCQPCKESELRHARSFCLERFQVEVEKADPKWVISLGGYSLHSALDTRRKPRITECRGTIVRQKTPSGDIRLVMPTVHPAYVMRAPLYESVIINDFERIERVIKEGYVPPEHMPGRKIVLARTLEAVTSELAKLGKYVGVDVETTSTHATTTRLVCLAVSDNKTSVVIPWSRSRSGKRRFFGSVQRQRLVAAAITEALSTRVSVTHNGLPFDQVVMEQQRHGIFINEWDDTMLAHQAIASHMPQRLSHVVSMYIDAPPWKLQPERSLRDHWKYNGRDSLYTVLAWEELQTELKPVRHVYEQNKAISRMCKSMQVVGFRFDKGRAAEFRKELVRMERKDQRRGNRIMGYEINLLSAVQLRKAFLEELGAPYFFISEKTGQPSLNVDTLRHYLTYQDEDLRGLAETVLHIRKARKTRSTYIDAIKLDREDRVHPSWKCGPVTGRMACAAPNLMNLTKPQNDPTVHLGGIRSLYIPTRGNLLVSYDWKQLEMRIAAYFSGDEKMIAACETSDLHATNATIIWGDDFTNASKEVKKDLRDIAKQSGFAIAYKAGADTVYARILASGKMVTLEQVEKMLRVMQTEFSAYYDFQDEEFEKVMASGYVFTPISRRRRFVGREPKPTKVANFPIQGGAADIMNTKLPQIVARLPKDVHLVAQVHDAAYFDTPMRYVDEVKALITEIAEAPVEMNGRSAVFPIDLKVGERWSEL